MLVCSVFCKAKCHIFTTAMSYVLKVENESFASHVVLQ